MIPLVISAIIIVSFTLWSGVTDRRVRSAPVGTLGAPTPWLIALALFACEALGVGASLYLTHSYAVADRNPFIISLIVACANFASLFSTRLRQDPITPLELFQYFKDGLLWPTALPVLAATLSSHH